MPYGYTLPLPSSSDINQQAHPGGGTRITDASREGLVEDLFEAHLRHLDVATKSAVCDKLCRISNLFDERGLSKQANLLDGILVRFAGEASGQFDATENAQFQDMADKADVKATITTITSYLLIIEKMIDDVGFFRFRAWNAKKHIQRIRDFLASDQKELAKREAEFMLSKPVIEGETWNTSAGSEIDMETMLSEQDLKTYITLMTKVRDLISLLPEEQDVLSQPRAKTQPRAVPRDERLVAFEKRLNGIISKYRGVDAQTEDWKTLMTPVDYRKTYNDLLQRIPNVGALNTLPKYKRAIEDGQVDIDNVAYYDEQLNNYDKILENVTTYVKEVNGRLSKPPASTATTAPTSPSSVDYGTETSVEPTIAGGG